MRKFYLYFYKWALGRGVTSVGRYTFLVFDEVPPGKELTTITQAATAYFSTSPEFESVSWPALTWSRLLATMPSKEWIRFGVLYVPYVETGKSTLVCDDSVFSQVPLSLEKPPYRKLFAVQATRKLTQRVEVVVAAEDMSDAVARAKDPTLALETNISQEQVTLFNPFSVVAVCDPDASTTAGGEQPRSS